MNFTVQNSWLLRIPRFSLILSPGIQVKEAMTDEILTLKEVAEYLKLAEKTAYRLAAEGKLPGFKVGGSWRFKREDVLSWIEDSKKGRKD
ncbi:methylation-associated defense system helix-turn-helix domain-containing protein MAD1 [Thiolapillus sp.]